MFGRFADAADAADTERTLALLTDDFVADVTAPGREPAQFDGPTFTRDFVCAHPVGDLKHLFANVTVGDTPVDGSVSLAGDAFLLQRVDGKWAVAAIAHHDHLVTCRNGTWQFERMSIAVL